MPIVPLYGHATRRERFRESVARDALPPSLLIHGPRGIGKQRLALWLGQLLLCSGPPPRPCLRCENCRYVAELAHPDLRWFFPRPRLPDGDATPEELLADNGDAVAERVAEHGLYAPADGTAGIFVSAVRALVKLAAYTPSVARRKVFVVGDAERMVPQEGSEFAANAFLKLLEEPPRDTVIILTSSEPAALLPTIRSRMVAVRAAPLAEPDVREFLADPMVVEALARLSTPASSDDRVRVAAGAPGALFAGSSRSEAQSAARALLTAATGSRADRFRAAFALKATQARGFFSEVLDALTVLLVERVRNAAAVGDATAALSAQRAIEAVEQAKQRAGGNISPQLVGNWLLRTLSEVLV